MTHCITSWNTPYTFSGKEKDVETGYSYFGARYYDSDLSIWLSVDPMSDKYPSMSPYNYCANNPVILVDPDGRDVSKMDWKKDKNGNWVAEAKDNASTLARDAKISLLDASNICGGMNTVSSGSVAYVNNYFANQKSIIKKQVFVSNGPATLQGPIFPEIPKTITVENQTWELVAVGQCRKASYGYLAQGTASVTDYTFTYFDGSYTAEESGLVFGLGGSMGATIVYVFGPKNLTPNDLSGYSVMVDGTYCFVNAEVQTSSTAAGIPTWNYVIISAGLAASTNSVSSGVTTTKIKKR